MPLLYLFDLDGTLVDTAPDIALALNDVLRAQGLPEARAEQVRSWIGHGSEALLGRAVAELGRGAAPAAGAMLDDYLLAYERRCGQASRLFPGVIEALDALTERGARLAIVSNRETRLAHAVLAAHGLRERFAPIVCGDTLAARKPDALPLLHCLQHWALAPAQALMVGDSPIDLQAARAAGVRCALLRHGYGGPSIEDAGADQLLDDLRQLLSAPSS